MNRPVIMHTHLFFSASLWLLLSCNRYDPQQIFLPQDSYMTVHFNCQSLNGKGEWSKLSKEWFPVDSFSTVQDSIWLKMMSADQSTGIDLKQGLYLTSSLRGAGRYRCLQGMLKDSSAFLGFNKLLQESSPIYQEDDLHVLPLNNLTLLVWNGYRFLCITDAPVVTEEIRRKENTMEYAPPYSIPADSLLVIAREIFRNGPKHSLQKEERFAEMLQEPGDLNIWTNPSSLGYVKEEGLAGLWQSMSLLEGEENRTAVKVFFDEGMIRCQATEYLSEQWAARLEDAPASPLNEQEINRIPSDLTTVLIGVCVPSGLMPYLLQQQGVFQLFDALHASDKEFVNKLAKVTGGTLLMALGAQAGEKDPSKEKVLLAGTLRDKNEFVQLFAASDAKNDSTPFTSQMQVFAAEDSWFAGSNDSTTAYSFLNNKNNVHPYAKKMAGHLFSFYADLGTLKYQEKAGAGFTESSVPGNSKWKELKVEGDITGKGRLGLNAMIGLADPQQNFFQQKDN